MVMLLLEDWDVFQEKFPDAMAFLQAASIRKECYDLCPKSHNSDWEKNRFNELIETPACQEAWFQDIILEQLFKDLTQKIPEK